MAHAWKLPSKTVQPDPTRVKRCEGKKKISTKRFHNPKTLLRRVRIQNLRQPSVVVDAARIQVLASIKDPTSVPHKHFKSVSCANAFVNYGPKLFPSSTPKIFPTRKSRDRGVKSQEVVPKHVPQTKPFQIPNPWIGTPPVQKLLRVIPHPSVWSLRRPAVESHEPEGLGQVPCQQHSARLSVQ